MRLPSWPWVEINYWASRIKLMLWHSPFITYDALARACILPTKGRRRENVGVHAVEDSDRHVTLMHVDPKLKKVITIK